MSASIEIKLERTGPELFKGGVAVDDRGCVRFVNGFDFKNVKRFYQVSNHEKGFIRAWHGHYVEGKYVYVAKGSALIGTAMMTNGRVGLTNAKKYILSDKSPSVLWIPPGHANGAMTLEEDTQILYFSTTTMEECLNDDIRYRASILGSSFWDIERR
jgi:dTDP-4-dehydrorhamnose 3,5-epimerase